MTHPTSSPFEHDTGPSASTDPEEPLIPHAVLEKARSELEVGPEVFLSFDAYRASASYRSIYEQPSPRVTICICTYNRSRVLLERAVPSALKQDYENLEILVVGDGCTDDTGDSIDRLRDPRIRFINVPRGSYPEHPLLRWLVAGTIPANHALGVATGELITFLDDDDEFTSDRVRKLVKFLQQTGAEIVWHPFMFEVAPDSWLEWAANSFEGGAVTTGSTLYLSWFKNIPYDPTSYRYPEPSDWNRYRKLVYLGAKMARYPEPLLRHYRERTQLGRG